MDNQWGKLVAYFVGTFIVTSLLTVGVPMIGGGGWLPDAISSEASSIDAIFWGLVWLSIVIFSMVGALVVYSVRNFQAEPGDESDGEHIHGHAKLEFVWVIVPAIIVTVIAGLSYQVLQENEVGLYSKARAADSDRAATMTVDVRAFSFGWGFRYEGMEATESSSELVVPIDETIRFDVLSCSGQEQLARVREQIRREHAAEHGGHGESGGVELAAIEPGICEREWNLSTAEDVEAAEVAARALIEARDKDDRGDDLSDEEQAMLDALPKFRGDSDDADVNHAFWVPEARLKIDAISGLRTFVQWKPTKITTPDDHYQVVCAELCGSGHNSMRTDMCVVDEATFSWWLALSEDDRRTATCANLRYLTCDDMPGAADAVPAINEVVSKDADATCDEVREGLAA